MSEAERKSHIPDEKLAELTTEKLQELEEERSELDQRLQQTMGEGGTLDPKERERLTRQIQNHDAATEKLTSYRADMLEADDN